MCSCLGLDIYLLMQSTQAYQKSTLVKGFLKLNNYDKHESAWVKILLMVRF